MNWWEKAITTFVVVFLLMAWTFIVFVGAHSGGYTQGQIDALTGKVKVELVESPDGSKNWKRKDTP